jgi:hypothetical protein
VLKRFHDLHVNRFAGVDNVFRVIKTNCYNGYLVHDLINVQKQFFVKILLA